MEGPIGPGVAVRDVAKRPRRGERQERGCSGWCGEGRGAQVGRNEGTKRVERGVRELMSVMKRTCLSSLH